MAIQADLTEECIKKIADAVEDKFLPTATLLVTKNSEIDSKTGDLEKINVKKYGYIQVNVPEDQRQRPVTIEEIYPTEEDIKKDPEHSHIKVLVTIETGETAYKQYMYLTDDLVFKFVDAKRN